MQCIVDVDLTLVDANGIHLDGAREDCNDSKTPVAIFSFGQPAARSIALKIRNCMD